MILCHSTRQGAADAMPKIGFRDASGDNAQSATKSSRITTTSCQTTKIRRGWEERGETITRTISKQHTGGVMKKKSPPEWKTDYRSASPFHSSPRECASRVPAC